MRALLAALLRRLASAAAVGLKALPPTPPKGDGPNTDGGGGSASLLGAFIDPERLESTLMLLLLLTALELLKLLEAEFSRSIMLRLLCFPSFLIARGDGPIKLPPSHKPKLMESNTALFSSASILLDGRGIFVKELFDIELAGELAGDRPDFRNPFEHDPEEPLLW